MVHQRLAHLERVGHAGAVDLGIDVADKIGLQVQVLDQRQRVFGTGASGVEVEHLLRAVARQLTLQCRAEEPGAHRVAKDRHRMKVGFDSGTRHALEGGLGAEDPRSPVSLRVDTTQPSEQRLADPGRQRRAHAFFHQVQAIAPVAAESLIATISRQRHGHVLARQLAHAVGRDGGTVGVRFVVQASQGVDEIEIIGLHRLDTMVGGVARSHHGGEFALVEFRIVERDGAGIDRAVRQTGHRRHHRAGIDAARQECAQRHLRNHAQAHGFLKLPLQFSASVLLANRVVQREVHVPVFTRLTHRLAATDRQRVRRRQLARLAKHGAGLGNVPEREILLDGERIDVAFQGASMRSPVGQQRLQLTAEKQRSVVQQCVVERLDAHSIASHEERLAIAVPQHEREHATKAFDTRLAPLLPGMHDDLGIAFRVKAMPGSLQFRDQFLVVVDLAIEDHHHRTVFIEQRLLTRGHIDDRQAPVAKTHARLDVQAALIGAAMQLGVVHALQRNSVGLA